jgi:hypothetical protein
MVPVITRASSEARNIAARAISMGSGEPSRFFEAILRVVSLVLILSIILGVRVVDGAIAFTRIRSFA